MVPLLSEKEIQSRACQLTDWIVDGQELRLTRKFKDFIEAINFINKLVEPSEAAGHHPDLAISYNRVTITLTTHDAGGLTEKDFELAQALSKLD